MDRDFGHFSVSPRKFDAIICLGDICVSIVRSQDLCFAPCVGDG
jgi:hypothetical protein